MFWTPCFKHFKKLFFISLRYQPDAIILPAPLCRIPFLYVYNKIENLLCCEEESWDKFPQRVHQIRKKKLKLNLESNYEFILQSSHWLEKEFTGVWSFPKMNSYMPPGRRKSFFSYHHFRIIKRKGNIIENKALLEIHNIKIMNF